METITLCQLISGNVAAEDSPQRQGGFQTLLHGASLTGQELAEAAGRLVYTTAAGTPVKRVFHRLASGRVLLARLAAEPADAEAPRDERCFAHGLILSEADFLVAGGDAGSFFATYPFLRSVEEARQVGDWHTGLLDDHTLAVPQLDNADRYALLAEWPVAVMHNLLLLALRAPVLVAKHIPLLCKGNAEECYAFLSALVLLLPPEVRIHCTFDTDCSQSDRAGMSCWALCEPQPAAVAAGQPFLDIAARQATPGMQPETPYERWITRLAARQLYEEIVRQGELMYWFSHLLEGRKSSQPIYALQEIPQYYYKNEMPAIQATLLSGLSASFGKRLGSRLAANFDPQQHRTEIEAGFFGRLEPEQACVFLALAYRKEQFHRPETMELEQLAQLLQKAPHRSLQILHSLWSGNTAGAREQLGSVSEGEYGMYVRIFLTYKVATPAALLVPSYAPAFVQQFLALPQRPYPEVDKVVAALVELKAESTLDAFTPALEHTDGAALQATAKFCRGNKAVPTAFQTALQAQLSHGKGGGGLGGMLGKIGAGSGGSKPSASSASSKPGAGNGGGGENVFQRLLSKLPGKK